MDKENVLCGRFVLRGLLAAQRLTSSWHCIWLAEDKDAGPDGKSDVVVKKYNLEAQQKQEDFHDLAHHITVRIRFVVETNYLHEFCFLYAGRTKSC
jgi:hypothetical protein